MVRGQSGGIGSAPRLRKGSSRFPAQYVCRHPCSRTATQPGNCTTRQARTLSQVEVSCLPELRHLYFNRQAIIDHVVARIGVVLERLNATT
jgi:hypothetical protein